MLPSRGPRGRSPPKEDARYRDSESLMQHAANLGELMAAIMKVASFPGEICGTPSPALVKALEGSGVRVFKLHQSL